jgi:NAD(P)-dependent dehydrogenase (short-subunit alcohol dehydrogenase family)
MTTDFTGKVALVTGAGRGLGFAIAKALLTAGGTVAVNDRTPEAVEAAIGRLGEGCRAIAAPADLSDAEGARRAVAAAASEGRLDLLVNNAAINIEKPIEETDDDLWDRHLAIVLKASFFTVQAALPLLAESRGLVINIASELGLQAIPNNVAYVAAKHGVVAMTRALAIELAGTGVRVNALCPGTMDTELMQECAAASPDPAAYRRAFEAYHPVGRLASPHEVADFVLCLAAPAASFMTGAAVALDGGSSAGRL